ncbi:MAG: thioredoxin family protein [Myxococcales bacterium]|nr:thioredoxin family protein [Myxococcales bacterium]
MSTRHAAFAAVFFFASVATVGAWAADDGGLIKSGTRWLPVEQALAEGKRTGKPVLVVSWAEWCPACRRMFEEVLGGGDANKFTREYQRRFVLGEVEIGRRGERAKDAKPVHYDDHDFAPEEFVGTFFGSGAIPWFTVFDATGEHTDVSFDTSSLAQAMLYFSSPELPKRMTFEEFIERNPL